MTALDNVALWHERDISHSSAERLILPDACIALDYMLDLLTTIYDGLEVSSEAMTRNLESTRGLISSGQRAAGTRRERDVAGGGLRSDPGGGAQGLGR